VTYGMTKVEGFSGPLFIRIIFDDPLLNQQGFLQKRYPIDGPEVGYAFDGIPHSPVCDEGVLQCFCVSAFQLTVRKGFVKSGIDKNGSRIVEHTQCIFEAQKIHSYLSADAGIELTQKSGWNLDKFDSAFVCTGYESTQISHYPTAEIDQK